MKDHPIPFTGAMVRAVRDGTKFQTRRIVKLPRMNPLGKWEVMPWGGPNGGRTRDGQTVPFQNVIGHSRTGEIIGCPYGQPGDGLWVREAWRTVEAADKIPPRDLGAASRLWFEADAPHQPGYGKYRPGMFMPRWASRITLEVTGARVERLQDISEADAIAEGIEKTVNGFWSMYGHAGVDGTYSPRASYRALWEQINGEGAWALNPWVWVIEFKRLAP